LQPATDPGSEKEWREDLNAGSFYSFPLNYQMLWLNQGKKSTSLDQPGDRLS
jgi:hypothetical protein